MFFKKYLLVILIFLSLICSISAVSAENTILADDSINDQNMDFDAQPSVSIGVLDDSTLDASSSRSDDRSSAMIQPWMLLHPVLMTAVLLILI